MPKLIDKPINDIPNRKYCGGDKEMFTARMPKRLLKELRTIADAKGWSLTDLTATVLDLYAQSEAVKAKRR